LAGGGQRPADAAQRNTETARLAARRTVARGPEGKADFPKCTPA
jgi:hypothetical protein